MKRQKLLGVSVFSLEEQVFGGRPREPVKLLRPSISPHQNMVVVIPLCTIKRCSRRIHSRGLPSASLDTGSIDGVYFSPFLVDGKVNVLPTNIKGVFLAAAGPWNFRSDAC